MSTRQFLHLLSLITFTVFIILTEPPHLKAQTTFTKVTADTVVGNDGGRSVGTAWGDFDNDGDEDLFVTSRNNISNALYENDGNGQFTRLDLQVVFGETVGGWSTSATWGDYNNDGHLDLFVTNDAGDFLNFLYLNNGDKTFTKITNGAIVNDLGPSLGSGWADYNNDGFIDLFVGNTSSSSINFKGDNFLYKNNGDGTFEKITEGDIFNLSANSSRTAAWADVDNDGFIDLFTPTDNTSDYFYHNDGDGRFTLITNTPLALGGSGFSGSWGDYDNDGDLDLFVTNGGTVQDELNYLFENNGDGSFTRITEGDITNDLFRSTGSAWGDFDNDGDLDLFVANIADQDNQLYRNLLMENGDKTFEKVTGEAIVSDGGQSTGSGWADFNNDGFLDLVVANTNSQNNFLYQNNGNSNHWIKIKCVGTLSNRFAIGAEVRVRAIINGSPVWQMRQIEAQSGYGGQNSLITHFGLADATVVDSIIVEWPSGIIQKIDNIPGDQIFAVTEAGEVPLRANFSASVVRGTTPFTVEFQDLSTADQASPITSWQWDFDNDGTTDSLDPNPSHTYTNVGLQTVKLIVANGTATDTLTRVDYIEVLDRPLFEKITAQSVGNDGGFNRGASWVDYNNDGDLDLFVPSRGTNNFLYRNDGDGQLTRILDAVPPIATNARRSVGSTWGDYDNDGDLDLFVPANSGDDNVLYRNNGDETFDQIVSGDIVNDGGNSQSSSWGDYDNDGDLDLVVTNFSSAENNFLYRNDGNGIFTKITEGVIPNHEPAFSSACNWVDYDNDGNLDLFVANGFPNNFLYHNDGNGIFTKINEGEILDRGGATLSYSSSWGDYDNDGDLDLFVANGDPNRINHNLLYRNNGDGTFTRITEGDIVNDSGDSFSSSWGDFDNDGDLDLFVANSGEDNFLYQNEGDGTFTKITSQEIVQDGGKSLGAVWGDYDNDGFLDLFVANDGNENNFLYRGINNGNHWLKIKLIGQQSNTTAIGAKIRVKANINGVETRQLREISAQTGNHSMNSLNAHFGLGDAAIIDSIIVEWPSGIEDSFANIAIDQFLTIREEEPIAARVTANFYADLTSGSAPLTVRFTEIASAENTTINSWQWDFDSDGTIDSSVPNPSFTFSQIGSFSVTLIVSSDAVADTLIKRNYINIVGEAPFTRFTFGVIVTDGGSSRSPSWVDYDNDDDLDLFVSNTFDEKNFLYENDGNGFFTKVTSGDIVNDLGTSFGNVWGDYDNDGDLDLFVANGGFVKSENNNLYRNNGDGTFTKITQGVIVSDGGSSNNGSWGDYNNDSFLDLFVANSGISQAENNFLYRNNGDGTFTKIIEGDIVNDGGFSQGSNWIDYDNDGDLDLYVPNESGNNFLYQNNGDGTFLKITTVDIVNDGSSSLGSSWGDFDNDGDLDLFLANGFAGSNNFLYTNNGDGTFTKINEGIIVNDPSNARGSSWGDYDNDGDLDLFVSNFSEDNFLYQNIGNGKFVKITEGEVVSDGSGSNGAAWGDYNHDGSLDLFVAISGNSLFYTNNGNDNHWIDIKAVGTLSNTSAIGAKVRVKATINGKSVWQLNEISGQTGRFGQNSLNAHFGLGDATVIDSIKIEWPSGLVRFLTNVTPNQFLQVVENSAPQVQNAVADTSVTLGGDGVTIDLNEIFSDPDGDSLSYSVASSNTSILTAELSGSLMTLSPLQLGSADVLIVADDGLEGIDSTSLTVTVVENQPPVLQHQPVTSAQEGQPVEINAIIIDDLGVLTATLSFRRAGDSNFTDVQMTAIDQSGTFRGSIPVSSIPSRGLEYFITITDLQGLQTRSPATDFYSIQISFSDISRGIAQPSGSEQTAYRLISVPTAITNNSPRSVLEDDLGTYDDTKWRFFELRTNQNYSEFPNTSGLTPGKSFWLIVKDAGKVVDTGAGTSLGTSEDFVVNLHANWNFVSNPFNFPIPLTNVSIESGAPLDIRFFNGSQFADFTGSLQPFAGYAVFSNFADKLVINSNLASPTTVKSKSRPISGDINTLWSIRISAFCQKALDTYNYASVIADAAIGWDKYDRPEAPVIGEYVSIYFPHPEWGKAGAIYATDARPEPVDGEIWEFEVRTNIGDEINLRFDGIADLPDKFEVWLIDEAVHITRNLRQMNQYAFAGLASGSAKSLQLLIGEKEFTTRELGQLRNIPTSFELSQNFPNPFNPTTTIRYGLPAESRVTLKIFNLLGEEIISLVNNETKEAGFHIAIWNGKNKLRQTVASGIYVYQLRAGDFGMSKKMAFLK